MTSAKAESKKHVLFDDSPVIGTGLCRAWLKSRFRYCTSHVPNLIPILGQLKLLNSTLVLNVEFNSVDFNKLFLSKGKIYLLYSHTCKVCKKFGNIALATEASEDITIYVFYAFACKPFGGEDYMCKSLRYKKVSEYSPGIILFSLSC